MKIYADTSFIIPLYMIDTHSPDARRRMGLRPQVVVTQFHHAEVANALFQHVFRGGVSEQQAAQAYTEFERDCAIGVWRFTDTPESMYSVSVALAHKHVPSLGIRTLDTLHVAAALELKADAFWTFDQRQAKLAEAEGLRTN